MRSTVSVLLVVAACGAPPLYAHHSFAAAYREDVKVTIEAEVVQLAFRNPHSFLQVNAKDENGVMQKWSVEWGAAAQLTQQGVARDTLKPGDKVIITADPSRDPTDHRLRMRTIERPSDGWKYGANFD
jgi:Family of unknown function (DUF6152)